MIDTLVLNLPFEKYIVPDPLRFQPAFYPDKIRSAFGSRFFGTYKNNPTKDEKASGIYRPKLTIIPRVTKKGLEIPLKIEFSAPQLLFGSGNNIDEVQASNYQRIFDLLIERMALMGVIVTPDQLEQAILTNAHLSKNFLLSEGITTSTILKELEKIDLSKRAEINEKYFKRNDGHAVYFDFGETFMIVIYDKMADISKPIKKSVEKDKSARQLDLFQLYKETKSKKELLRFEIRLTNRGKLKAVLRKNGCFDDPLFKTIFNDSLVQKIMLDYWKTTIEENSYIFALSAAEPRNVFLNVLNALETGNSSLDVKEVFALYGFHMFMKNDGMRSLRDVIESRFVDRTWYRIRDKFKEQSKKIKNVSLVQKELAKIKNDLKEFKPFRSELLELDIIKNVEKSWY